MLEDCDDSAQSAPPNFNFDSGLLVEQDCSGDLLSQAMNVAITGNPIPDSGTEINERFLNSIRIPQSDLLTSSILQSPQKESVQFEPVNDHLLSGNFIKKILKIFQCC